MYSCANCRSASASGRSPPMRWTIVHCRPPSVPWHNWCCCRRHLQRALYTRKFSRGSGRLGRTTLPCEAGEGGGWGTVSWENDESLFLSLYLSHAVYTLQQQMEKLPSRGGVCVCSSETSWRCIWNTLLRGSVHGESGTVGVIESTGGAGVGRQVVFTSDVLHVCMSTASLTGHGCQFMLGDARIQVGVVQRVRGQVHAAHVCPNRRS